MEMIAKQKDGLDCRRNQREKRESESERERGREIKREKIIPILNDPLLFRKAHVVLRL
jgi:hypothetical protein